MQALSRRGTGGTSPLPAVILAAGFGSRLGSLQGLPKALMPLLGRPLLAYTLDGLAQAGVREVHVVVGHHGEQVRAALQQLTHPELAVEVIDNPNYALPNGSSLAAARCAVAGRPFLLLMADHLLSAAAVGRMLAAPHEIAIGIDRSTLSPARLADATRVQTRGGGLVTAFGKRLPWWDGIDAGIFRCQPAVFDAIDALGSGSEISAIMTLVATHRPFHAVDLTGAFWLDIDTPEDLAEAAQLLG